MKIPHRKMIVKKKLFLLGLSVLLSLMSGLLVIRSVSSATLPPAPSNLTATAVSSSQINLAWQNNAPEATSQLLYRAANADFSNATIFNLEVTAASFSDTGLNAGTTYYYEVYACNANGCAQSNVASATTELPSAATQSVSPGGEGTGGQGVTTRRQITVVNASGGTIIGKNQGGATVINCGAGNNECAYTVPASASPITIAFSVTPASGYTFSAWGGDCSGTPITSSCSFTWVVDDTYNVAVSAAYQQSGSNPPSSPPSATGNLSVQVQPSSGGSVTTVSSSKGVTAIDCGGKCNTNLTSGQYITLQANFASNFAFSGWSATGVAGGCTATNPVCMITNDGWGNATGTLSANFNEIVPTFSGSAAADVVYASTTAGTAAVSVTWPAAQNASGVTYSITRNGNQVGSTSSLSYYDTKAPLGGSVAYKITASLGLANTIGTIASNSVDLNIKNTLSGYAWANANADHQNGSATVIATSSFYNGTSQYQTQVGAGDSNVTISVVSPNDVWKGTIYRCSGYTAGVGCTSGKVQVDSFDNLNPGVPHTFTDSQLNGLTIYYYEIDGYGISSQWGLGTYMKAQTGGGTNYQGIGWVKFSSDTSSSPPDANQYGVSITSANQLEGYAWSGMQCPSGQTGNCGYGWLSFNDNNTSHPVATLSGNQLSGYARFLTFEGGNSSWDGWVNLSGVSYDPSTGNFSGMTSPAVDILGQMSFCGTGYCVTTGAVNQWPTNVTTTNVTANSFTVQWTNPQGQSYPRGMQVYLFNTTRPTSTVNVCSNDVAGCYQPISGNASSSTGNSSSGGYTAKVLSPDSVWGDLSAGGKNHAVEIDGLSASTTYEVFVRGLLK